MKDRQFCLFKIKTSLRGLNVPIDSVWRKLITGQLKEERALGQSQLSLPRRPGKYFQTILYRLGGMSGAK